MKKKIIFFCLIMFTGYVLCSPQNAVSAAAAGLVLWYEKVLPTLLPFAILSNILIGSDYLSYLTRYLAPVIRLFLPVSEKGSFVILSGFLFGFPMGSRNCAELLRERKISKREADVLFIITNNISPLFISSYILRQQLKMPELTIFTYLILYLPPLLLGSILLHHSSGEKNYPFHGKTDTAIQKKPASGSQMNFKIIDAGIMNGFETLTRLGGYIMLFSILSDLMQRLPIPAPLGLLLTGATEITNGIRGISEASLTPGQSYVTAIAFTAFGGLSGIAQTSSMVKDTGLPLKKYCIAKLFLTGISTLLAVGVVSLIQHI